MPTTRSRHAPALRNLGFEPMDEATQVYLSRQMDRKLDQMIGQRELTRSERRIFQQELMKPCFVIVRKPRAATYATDETGVHWCIHEAIDPWELTSIGFEDDTGAGDAAIEFVPLLLPQHMN